jgi:hypothetical protein
VVDKLNANDDLVVIGSLTSQNGQSKLTMQTDGNLVLTRSGGKARWASQTAGKKVSRAIMQPGGDFVLLGPGGAFIWSTQTHGHPGARLILQDDGNVVIYDAGGQPIWATNSNIIRKVVAGFLPSTSGFHFSNKTFPQVPDLKLDVMGEKIPIGDASKGLCGGMAFTARDYFEAGIPIPPDTANPSSGPLFDYLVKRLFDTYNLLLPPPPLPPVPGTFFTPTPPFGPGPFTYMHLMHPGLPDHETDASNAGLTYRGRAWVMVNDQWPKIKSDIDNGRLCPIALVMTKTLNPLEMGNNHQVLVYGYELDGTDLAIRIYDSNFQNDDTITMSLSIADPQHTTPVTYSTGQKVWCFFRPDYSFSPPPLQYDWRWCHKCRGLFFSGGQQQVGTCPGGGKHEKNGSGNYVLSHDEPAFNGQHDWRWCHRCQGLFFSGGQQRAGSCPAGGQHEKNGSGNYALAHEATGFDGQADWRWCHKCRGLFFSGGQDYAGSCPAGDQHEKGVSGNYTLTHTAAA